MEATYSPEDNKLRLYSIDRLDKETYSRIKEKGFRWAPKQGLFVAPMWTPERADTLIEMCGEIGDEDTSLIERQEQRAERFEGYKEKRAVDAEQAYQAVADLTDNIPMGQPILIGHHSERKARRDAKKIENTMKKAVKMWETSEYWQSRAKGAIRHAKYKENPQVRARRIKKIEAENRKYKKYIDDSEMWLKVWNNPNKQLTMERALYLANHDGYGNYWIDLRDNKITPEQAREQRTTSHKSTIDYYRRWVAHTNLRIAYEKAMLEDQGASDLLKPKPRPKQLPLLNYRAPGGIVIENRWNKGDFDTYPQMEMTKSEYTAKRKDDRGCETVENTHRVRVFIKSDSAYSYKRYVVFLTDSKVHEIPEKAVTCEQV